MSKDRSGYEHRRDFHHYFRNSICHRALTGNVGKCLFFSNVPTHEALCTHFVSAILQLVRGHRIDEAEDEPPQYRCSDA